MTEVEAWEDPILKLIQDPDLNKDREKSSQLLNIINSFPLTERKVSKLCQSSFLILQTLEKSNLTFKSWEFMSLDFNSDSHFNQESNLKGFNTILADKVLSTCSELQKKIHKISLDLDYITKSSKTLSAIEYISDSGTMLTSLLLRGIKLKNQVVESLSIAYSKAKLILIGQELEVMLDISEDSTLSTYKTFIVSLMKQLNQAIDQEDSQSKYECLAVISDMEKMFEAYKLERANESVVANYDDGEVSDQEIPDIAVYKEMESKKTHKHRVLDDDSVDSSKNSTYGPVSIPKRSSPIKHASTPHNSSAIFDGDVEDDEYVDSDYGSSSMYMSSFTQAPTIHSITKLDDHSPTHKRLNSITSMSTSQLYKTSITEELPYLMNAFNSTKNIAEDLSHFQEEEEREAKKPTKKESAQNDHKKKTFYTHKSNLPEVSLYSESPIISQVSPAAQSPPVSYFNSNSLLSKLGIKPQIITADISHKELANATKINRAPHMKPLASLPVKLQIKNEENADEKENRRVTTPLTRENLQSHTLLKLEPQHSLGDLVD